MQILTDDKIYIQKDDITFLNYLSTTIPKSILEVIHDSSLIINDNNHYDFMEFLNPEEIAFFKDLDWIIDYNEVKDFKDQDFKNLALKISYERRELITKFRNMTNEEKHKNADIVIKCELLEHKINSLRNIMLFKNGELKFDLPEEVKNEENTSPHKIKDLFKRLKK